MLPAPLSSAAARTSASRLPSGKRLCALRQRDMSGSPASTERLCSFSSSRPDQRRRSSLPSLSSMLSSM